MAKLTPTITQQAEAIKYIAETFDTYKKLMDDRMNDYLDIYREYSTFKVKKTAAWDTTFKVNKAHEVINKILPRIMAKSPKWLVSNKPDVINELNKLSTNEEKQARMQELDLYNTAIQDYLTFIFDKYNLTEPARLRAKNMLIYWSAFARVDFAYEISRTVDEKEEDVPEYNELWEEIGTKKEKVKTMKDYVWGEYPTILPLSWSDLFYDPRYKLFRQLPAIIEHTNWVRLSQLKQNKDKYINLDKVELLSGKAFKDNEKWFKEAIYVISWISCPEWKSWIDKNALTIKTYYGRFSFEWEDEKLYKISTVDDIIVICFEEITQIPFEQIRCFEDTETNFGRGLVEPIIWLQQELNFKKNSASTYINNSLNRSRLRSPNSGVNPKDLVSKPNGIIPTSKTVEEAQKNLFELPLREINPSYFNEQNDFERQIQAMTFTVDTSNPKTQNSLTNTATGARIKFFESNSVIDEIRKHFEEWLTSLWYKLLQATFENIEDNIIIRKQWEEGFREINKEALKDAIRKYEIKIESASSSYDNIEDRRDDAIAMFNMGLQAMGAGVPVDMTEMFKNTLDQFEKKQTDRFVKNPQLEQMLWGAVWWNPMWWNPLTPPEQWGWTPAALTEQVAQWWITSAMM